MSESGRSAPGGAPGGKQVTGPLAATLFDDVTPPALEVIQGIRRGERADVAERRGRVDIAIASLLSDAGRRRSEAAALTWADISREPDGSGRVTVRRSKTDQTGAGAMTSRSGASSGSCRLAGPNATPLKKRSRP